MNKLWETPKLEPLDQVSRPWEWTTSLLCCNWDTQSPSHPPHQLHFFNPHHPAMCLALAITDSHCSPSPCLEDALPIFVHLENSYSKNPYSSKGNSKITFSVKLFLITSKAAPAPPPLCSHDTLGRTPLYHSPYFIIVNCVHICLPIV